MFIKYSIIQYWLSFIRENLSFKLIAQNNHFLVIEANGYENKIMIRTKKGYILLIFIFEF